MASVVTGTSTATGYVKNILVRGYEKRKKPKTLFMYIIDLKWEPERVTTVLRSHPELLEFHVSHYPTLPCHLPVVTMKVVDRSAAVHQST